jgi:hypothetical protein
MSLDIFYEREPEKVLQYRAEQVVALAGDGRLRDGSECSTQLRQFLAKIGLLSLQRYVNDTLSTKFQDSGFVLQDLVNEVGRRLGFHVMNGRYHGVVNKLGHDGMWVTDEMALVVEVKTTDAYRINLTTLASYASGIKGDNDFAKKRFGILLVVGRQDTGDLEAQIRGSKFAWDVRVISVESLIELAGLCSASVDQTTLVALQSSLLPVEYTRVDHLVSLLSKLAFDVERSTIAEEGELEPVDLAEHGKRGIDTSTISPNLNNVETVREKVLTALTGTSTMPLARLSRSIYQSDSGSIYIISVSKRYSRNDQHYWYALQEKSISTLQQANSYLCLGMVGKEYYFRLPGEVVLQFPDGLNKTQKDSSLYWHMGLLETESGIALAMPRLGKSFDLTKFKVEF